MSFFLATFFHRGWRRGAVPAGGGASDSPDRCEPRRRGGPPPATGPAGLPRAGRSNSRFFSAAIALITLFGLSCSRTPDPPDILLITIDTLRADHLGAYGYPRPTSPRIDALARQGVTFRRAYAPVPRTTQSIATILTGLYPKHHRARGLFSYLVPSSWTLAEILKERGYATHAVVSNIFLQPGKGFEQGFDSYSNPRRRFDGDSSREITDEALARIGAATGRPWFLWVHYLDPHWSYEPEPEFVGRFVSSGEPSSRLQELKGGTIPKGDLIFRNPLPPEDRRHLADLYDAEIAQVDAQVGRLLDGLPRNPPRPRLIILTSDHGESLCEHEYCFAHGEYLYDGTLHVPLIFVYPGSLEPGVEITKTASLLDVAPTILRLLSLPDRPGMDGMSLFHPHGTGFTPSSGHPVLFAETDYQLIHSANPRYRIPGTRGRWSAVRRGDRKLIRIPDPGGDQHEYYDLLRDPQEKEPVPPGSEAGFAGLKQELDGWTDYEEGSGAGLDETLTDEQRERLRSLGYLQ